MLKNIAACSMERFNVSAGIINSGFGGAHMNETVEKAIANCVDKRFPLEKLMFGLGLESVRTAILIELFM